jgi:hypothetical protein
MTQDTKRNQPKAAGKSGAVHDKEKKVEHGDKPGADPTHRQAAEGGNDINKKETRTGKGASIDPETEQQRATGEGMKPASSKPGSKSGAGKSGFGKQGGGKGVAHSPSP